MSDHVDHGHLDVHDELAVGWVLHTLEPEDEAAFALHLADCARCERAVAETEETLGYLSASVTQVDPPPRLRRKLMDAVADEGTAMPRHVEEDTPEQVSDDDAAPAADVVPLAPRRRRVSRFVLAAAVAATVAVVGGLVVANQQLRDERDGQVAAAAQDAAQNAPVFDVLRDAGTPGVTHASLADTGGAMVGLVVDNGTGPRLLATGLDANRSDQIYVLWGLEGKQPTALGTFDVSGQGPVVSSVPSVPEAPPYGGFAVSLEPGRAAPASPTDIVASGQVGR